jgi:hypothetical protein
MGGACENLGIRGMGNSTLILRIVWVGGITGSCGWSGLSGIFVRSLAGRDILE